MAVAKKTTASRTTSRPAPHATAKVPAAMPAPARAPAAAAATPAPMAIAAAPRTGAPSRPAQPVQPVKLPKPAASAKPDKPRKDKLLRDSFTIPKSEYAVLEALKQRSTRLGGRVKKSELLRAGIKALAAMPDAAFATALTAVPAIKTGRTTGSGKA